MAPETMPVVTSSIDGYLYAVAPANFDGEGTDSRLARRKRNWIADVVIRGAS